MSRVRIIRRSALSEFAAIVSAYRDQAHRLWLISPWIGVYTDGSLDPLQLMIDSLRGSTTCIVTVITRRPLKNAEYHHNALRLLRENINPAMYYCDSLHTKLYVLEAGGFAAVVMGSPNLTAGGNSANIELAVEIRDTSRSRSDEISSVLDDLVQYAYDLLSETSVVIAD